MIPLTLQFVTTVCGSVFLTYLLYIQHTILFDLILKPLCIRIISIGKKILVVTAEFSSRTLITAVLVRDVTSVINISVVKSIWYRNAEPNRIMWINVVWDE